MLIFQLRETYRSLQQAIIVAVQHAENSQELDTHSKRRPTSIVTRVHAL